MSAERVGVSALGRGVQVLALTLVSLTVLVSQAHAQVNVLTQHNDNARTGANTSETILTPANVNSSTFGKLFSYSVDGYVYAQPLYVTGVTMGSGTTQAGTMHNVIFIVTEHDSVYAFDADSNGGANSSPLWHVSLVDSAHGGTNSEKPVPQSDVSTGDIVPEIGITGTPVIDPATNTIYVVAKSTVADTTFIQRLHALDITTGAEKFGGPVVLSGSVSGTGNGSSGGKLQWDPKWENQRPGLLLLNGIVYIGFAAHGDNGPWHGWILAYKASTLQQTSAYCTTPNGSGSGVWMSGAGLAADVIDPVNKPYGRMFIATGNGTYDALTPYTNNMDYGDDHVRLDLTNGVLTVQDSFTPSNQASLNGADQDVAAGGILLLPDQSSGGHQRLLVQVGKEGKIYVVDRDTMSGYNGTDQVVQEISGQTGGLWSMPAYWNNTVYFWGNGNNLKAFSLSGGKLSTTPVAISSASSGFPGATPSISANGITNGIVWALQTDAYNSNGNAVLHAFNATNVATELFNSTQAQPNSGPSNAAGAAVKFAVPTITNGKVYVGAETEVDVYGLLGSSQQTAIPIISPLAQSFTGTLSVTISDSTSGASIYYTTDGSTPSTSSTKYTGSISVSSTETISAIASATGYLTSAMAQQTYTLQTQTLAPTFSPVAGSYGSAQTVTISDATPNSQIYYTSDGTTPSPGGGTTKLYSGPLTVSSTTTLNAIATASGLSNSPVATATYTISLGGTGVNFSNGFSTSASTMTFNGSTGLDDTRLQLTSGGANQAGSAWYNTPVNIQAFSTDFTIQLSNPAADGITFTIQNAGLTALGPSGGGLGYGPDSPTTPSSSSNTPIAKSVAIKFDIYDNAGEGPNSTGLYTNGASPTTPAINLTGTGIDLHSGDTMSVHLAYDGTTFSMSITDPVAITSFKTSWTVNIPGIVGGNTAFVGFTGGTGGATSSQKIGSWTFTSTGSTPTAATPTITPASGTYTLPVSVTLADSISGASIYYTTDGTAPTTNSTLFSAPFALSGPMTVKAIASASGYNPSAVATSTYAIQVATPIFSPAPGIYAAAQSVTITDTTPNSTIYYTLDGTTPTTSSSLYSGPVFVGSTETLTAIAVASGSVTSQPLAGLYTINSTGGTSINFGSGFGAGNMTLLSAAKLSGTSLRITDGGTNEVSAAWYPNPINIQSFTTDFTFLIMPGSSPTADGFAFVIQGIGTAAIGPFGGGLGYGPETTSGSPGIGMSVAVKFDLYSNAGEGVDSTGLYTNGTSPTTPFVDLSTSPIDLHSGHAFKVHMTYDGANLTMSITDTTTNGIFAKTWGVNIPAIVGGNAAFVGFTGGTGGLTAVQDIQNWTFSASVTQSQAATPTFSPPGGTYSNAQNVTISTTTPGATVYYTTDGSTPTTSSSRYSGAAAVGATETLNAIAVAAGYTNSAVGSASYSINSGGGSTINYSAGFSTSGLALNGSAALSGTRLRLTNSGNNLAGSAWFNTPVTISNFTTDFTFQLSSIGSSAFGNGITFVIQNAGTSAVGPSGGGLGYGPDKVTSPSASPNSPISKSVAVKFDIVNNSGEGTNSTGLYLNGASPTMPAITPTGGVNLRSGDTFKAHISYDGTTLTLTLTDQVNTSQTFTTSWAVNVPSVVGGTTAYVGFTGGTGASVANQDIITWTFSNGAASQAPAITSSGTASGTVGTSFGYQITATNSPASFGATGLPAGLAVNTSTGLISGTLTAAGTSNVSVSATNGTGTGSATLTLTVSMAAPVITSSNTASGTVGVSFSYQITGTNSPTSFNATGLPAGLIVNTNTGLISGTPAAAGTSSVTVSATNGGGTGSATLTLTVNAGGQAPIVYHTTILPAVSSGPTFRQFSDVVFPDGTGTIIDASAPGDNVTFTVNIPTAGTYDIKLSYKAYTTRGISQLSINGTNVGSTSDQYAATATLKTFDYGAYNFSSARNYSFKFTVTSKNASSSGYTISFDDLTLTPQSTVAMAAPVITSATTVGGTIGVPFSYQITATNSPTSYGATGLPAGLTLNTGTGLIAGTPTATGTFNVIVNATNGVATGSASLTLTIGGGNGSPVYHRIQISNDADDGYFQNGTGWHSTPGSSGADLVGSWSGVRTNWVTGYRFPTVGANSGDTVRSAYLQLVSGDGSANSATCGSEPCTNTNYTFRIYGVAQDDGPAFNGTTGNTPLDVPYTSAYVDYLTTGPGDVHGSCQGNNSGQNTCTHIIDVTNIVREITSRPGWTGTSAMRFVLLSTDSNAPNAYAGFEDSSANAGRAATLVVNPPQPTIVSTGAWGTGASTTYPTTYKTGPFVYPGASALLLFLGDYYNFYSQPIPQPAISDSCGNTWNILTGPTNWVGISYYMRSTVYYVQNPAACPAGDTITVTVSVQEPIFLHFLAVAGSDTTTAPVVSAITSPSPDTYTTTATSNAIALSKPGLLVSWIFGDSDAPHVFTPGAGFVKDLNSTPTYLTLSSESVASPGSYQSQFAISPSDGWQVVIVGLQAP